MKNKTVIYIFFLVVMSVVPVATVLGYVPLAPVPYIDTDGGTTMNSLLNALFAVSISVAAVLAVIMLAIGGFKYMTSESVFKMGDAREQIANAIIGLLIILLSVLILRTIHPNIVSLNLFNNLPPAGPVGGDGAIGGTEGGGTEAAATEGSSGGIPPSEMCVRRGGYWDSGECFE